MKPGEGGEDPTGSGPGGAAEGSGGSLVEARRRFVAAKYRIDDFLDSMWERLGDLEAVYANGLDWLISVGQDAALDDESWLVSRFPGFYEMDARDYALQYSLSPLHFVMAAFPVYEFRPYSRAAMKLGDIDPSLTISGTYRRGWPEHLSEADLTRINERASDYKYDSEHTTPGRLPLYIAHEGKNRVRAFMNSGHAIRSDSCQGDFPEATALELHRVEEPSSTYVDDSPMYVVSDTVAGKEYVLPLPSVTIPILEAYGVSWGGTLERGPGCEFVWQWQEQQRKVLHSLVSDFMRP